jgi:hypothetical protein
MVASISEALRWKIGYAADPGIDILLDKAKLAQIRIRKLDMLINELNQHIELLDMERDMLREEYKIK